MTPFYTDRNNYAKIAGKVMDDPHLDRFTNECALYRFLLEVDRLYSDNKDIIPVTVPGKHVDGIQAGDYFRAEGQVRTPRVYDKKLSRNVLNWQFLVKEILENTNPTQENVVKLKGFICQPPVNRTTPLTKKDITDLLVAVNREGGSDYIHCIAWDSNAKYASFLQTGDSVDITGMFQSRIYQKQTDDGIQEKTAYEISISKLEAEALRVLT